MKPAHCSTSLLACLLLLAACGHSPGPAAMAAAVDEAEAKSAPGLVLTAEQRATMGVAATPAAEAGFVAESPGYGLVIGHEAVAVASAEVATAQAALRQSQATLARTRGLAGTPGALPVESTDAAERQATTDAAALVLAQRRLTALLGLRAPVNADGSALLAALATGRVKLVRATFPLGALSVAVPKRLRLARLDGGNTRSWHSELIWEAPGDASMPGRSLYAVLNANEVSEGERLQVWAATGANIKGAFVPASAVIQSQSAYWCFVERPGGGFTRTAIDITRPVAGGYFVSAGIAPGDSIVTSGAGLLLARETNPSTEADE